MGAGTALFLRGSPGAARGGLAGQQLPLAAQAGTGREPFGAGEAMGSNPELAVEGGEPRVTGEPVVEAVSERRKLPEPLSLAQAPNKKSRAARAIPARPRARSARNRPPAGPTEPRGGDPPLTLLG